MAKYQMVIGFETDRELTEKELGDLQNNCVVQIDDPADSEGSDYDFTTSILGCDVDKVGN